jgi:GAF domain-containing protein
MIALARLADIFVEVADTLVDDFDLIEFLHTVTVHAVEVSGETAAGVLIADHHGRLQHVGASSESARLIELSQLQNAEGPCLDSFNRNEVVVVPDLASATERWPRFTAAATAAGFRSVHAFPLRLRNQIIGAINVFGSEPRDWTANERKIIQGLANIAAISLIQEQALERAELVNEQLQGALNSRIIIEQAKGAVARVLNLTPEEAFLIIRKHARDHQQPLTSLAQQLVTDPSTIEQLGPRTAS